MVDLGRSGNIGGGGSSRGLPGGVLNGEDLSCELYTGAGSTFRDIGLLATLGFSALLTTGGAGLGVASRRNSPDLRGGGGEGG